MLVKCMRMSSRREKWSFYQLTNVPHWRWINLATWKLESIAQSSLHVEDSSQPSSVCMSSHDWPREHLSLFCCSLLILFSRWKSEEITESQTHKKTPISRTHRSNLDLVSVVHNGRPTDRSNVHPFSAAKIYGHKASWNGWFQVWWLFVFGFR